MQPILEDFARDFFEWESSSWIRRQHAKGRRFCKSIAKCRQGHLDKYILPHFGKTLIGRRQHVPSGQAEDPVRPKRHSFFLVRLQVERHSKHGTF